MPAFQRGVWSKRNSWLDGVMFNHENLDPKVRVQEMFCIANMSVLGMRLALLLLPVVVLAADGSDEGVGMM
jgi:hypothetical protein